MEPLRAILIDDEESSLENLEQKIKEFCPDVTVVACTQKPEDAIPLINSYKPDVVFLDIEMPRMNGFRMLEETDYDDFSVIFTTAYNHYAIDAIRVSAADYLLKPVAIKELQSAVERLIRKKSQGGMKKSLEIIRETVSSFKKQDELIAIPSVEGLELIPVKSIVHIDSSSNYSKIFFEDGKTMVVTKLLGDFEEILQPYNFFRVHNSHLINLSWVKKYLRTDGGQVVMKTGEVIDVSRRKREEFIRLLTS